MSYTLDTQIQSSTLYLDSTNCISRKPMFKYGLASSITCPTACRMLISVIGMSLPNVIHNVHEHNNQISFSKKALLGTIEYTITFPIGIYSAWSFRDYLNLQLTNLALPIACTYSPMTFQYTFLSTASFSIVNNSVNPTTCSHLIGVDKDDTNQFVFPIDATTPYYTLVMPSCVNFSPTPYIFLKIGSLTLRNINSQGYINDTFVRIPVNCEYGQMIQYRPSEINRFLIQRTDINSVELRLEDIHNNPLAIPSGAELQVIIKIDYIYPPVQQSYAQGTIEHFFKENPMPDPDDPEEPDNVF